MDVLEEARKVFDLEIEALIRTRNVLGGSFEKIIEMVTSCEGKVVITGVGKPGHIAKKIAATFSSLGTCSFFLHPGEALHGDVGMISSQDVIVAISYSGESDEVIRLIPACKMVGASVIGITGNPTSSLAQIADVVQVLPSFDEACHLGLAPTSSTTATLCYGDALAVVASEIYGFSKTDFGKVHPAGALGKKLLLRVSDVMIHKSDTAIVSKDASLKNAIVEMSKKGLSIVSEIEEDTLIGILTDGDLRRLLENNADIYNLSFDSVITKTPTTIQKTAMAVDALKTLKDKRFSSMPVIDDGKYIGIVTLHSIISAGIVI